MSGSRSLPREEPVPLLTAEETEAESDADDGVARFDGRPTRVGSAVSMLLGAVAVVATLAGGLAALVSVAGLAGLALGLRRGTVRTVTLGSAVQFAGVLLAGVLGAPPEAVLLAAAFVVVAWDVGEHAVGLGAQVGRRAATTRAELVHAAGSTLVASTAAAVAYLAFQTLASESVLALVLLALGGLLIAALLRA